MNSFSVFTVSFLCMCVIFFLCFCVANELFRPWPAFIGCLSINSNSISNSNSNSKSNSNSNSIPISWVFPCFSSVLFYFHIPDV